MNLNNFVIMTDSCSDLPIEIIEKHNIAYLGIVCNFMDKEIIEDGWKTISPEEFYEAIKNGAMPTTSQINNFRFYNEFEKYAKQDVAVIYIAFSSTLSGTYNSAVIAKEEIKHKYPKADITVIDSKSASSGLGLLVYKAIKLKENNKSKDEIIRWVEDNKLKICHYFTVDDLNHLKRGGRINTTTAAIGSILNIKPVSYLSDEGELKPFSKAKGMKKAVKALYNEFAKHITEEGLEDVIVTHADNLKGATELIDLIRGNHNVSNIIISNIGMAVGSHTGAGTISVYFIGTHREP